MPGPLSTTLFVGLCFAVVAMVVAAHRHAYAEDPTAGRAARTAAAGWLVATYVVAGSGALLALAGTPGVALFPLVSVGVAIGLAASPAGRAVVSTVPIAALVGFQAFRLPLELILHRWHVEGALPVQMTWSGQNPDIVTGVEALGAAVALATGAVRGVRAHALVAASNLLGLGLLLNVMRVALRSVPSPMRAPGFDELTLPLHAPYAWLVAVCVAGAMWGHVVVFRWMWRQRAGAEASAG